MKPGNSAADPEDYELQETHSSAQEPLLPRYEVHPHNDDTKSSPFTTRRPNRSRSSQFRRAVGCVCLVLAITVPFTALLGCWYGRTTLDKVRTWEQLPPEWREWLNQVAPKHGADHGSFPTE
jgi:hypothetical protein